MNYKTFKVNSNYSSVYYFLKEGKFSENYIKNLRKAWGNILINDKIVNIRTPLKKDDILKLNDNPNQKTTIMQCIIPLNIVYEDEYYLLVNKPSNLPSIPSKKHYSNNLAGAICYYMGKKDNNFVLRMINRLDKDTAGLVIVAKDSISQNKIKDIKKGYYAICEGKIDQNLTIDKKIETITNDGINEQKRIISEQGKDCTTFVYPQMYNEKYSLIKLNLIYGRTHQIRVHLSSIGHPLLGDCLYGESSELINHTALVCKEIQFYHPFLNKELSFSIDYPQDIKDLINKLFGC